MPDTFDHLPYYTTQSVTSDPSDYSLLYEALPNDVASIAHTIQGLMIHDHALRLHGLELTEEKEQEINLRTISDRLARLQEINAAPLTEARIPEERVTGTCRDFALLFVSMARHQGIPARERVGFAPYLGTQGNPDHRIAEYWNVDEKRWILIDPQIDEITRQSNKAITFDALNMVSGEHFYVAGDAWQRCRAGEADPLDFRDSPTDLGIPAILLTVVHDLERLNKVELLGWDDWSSPLIQRRFEPLSDGDLTLIDRMAELTLAADDRFAEMQTLYESLPESQIAKEKMTVMGLLT